MSVKLTSGIEIDDATEIAINGSCYIAVGNNQRGVFDVALAANALVNFFAGAGHDIIYRCTNPDRGRWYYWTGRHWQQYGEANMETDVRRILGSITAQRVKQIVATMRIIAQRAWDLFDQKLIVAYENVCLMYDVTSGEISKAAACKEDYVTWFIPLTLGKAEHPSWTKVLDKILPNEQDQRTLQEIFGVCLFPAFCPQAHFTLVGPAHTGKSTITRMLREMVGPGNSSSVSLGSLSKDHAAMGLIGSFVNVDSESGYLSSEAEDMLKRITGGDQICINIKYGPVYSAPLPVKLVRAVNELNRVIDKTDGFWSREVLLPFGQPIHDRQPIERIIARLQQEKSGIFAWALKGLKRVVRKGNRSSAFTQSQAALEALEDHRLDSDPFLQFVDEFIEIKQGPAVEKQHLYDLYKNWCTRTSRKQVMTDNSFGKRMATWLREQGVANPTHRPHRGGRCWASVNLRKEEEAPTDQRTRRSWSD